jgi:hypothetical protein
MSSKFLCAAQIILFNSTWIKAIQANARYIPVSRAYDNNLLPPRCWFLRSFCALPQQEYNSGAKTCTVALQ